MKDRLVQHNPSGENGEPEPMRGKSAHGLLSEFGASTDPLAEPGDEANVPGRLWAVAGPAASGKTYVTACLSYLLSTSRERAVPVDATLSGTPGQKDLNGQLLPVIGGNATRNLSESTFEALSALRHVLILRHEALTRLPTGSNARTTDSIHVVLDLGPGTLNANLAYLPLADDPVLVTRVDQESFVRTLMVIYRAVLECWRWMFRSHPQAAALTESEIGRQKETLYTDLKLFLRRLDAVDADAASVAAVVLQRFRPGVIFNAVQTADLSSAIDDLWQLAMQELGVELDYLGALPHDPGAVEFKSSVQSCFVADSSAPAARWAARELARKLHVPSDVVAEKSGAKVGCPRRSPADAKILICSDSCDKWNFCGFRDPGYACTIQYLQPPEYGLIKPVHLENLKAGQRGVQAKDPPGEEHSDRSRSRRLGFLWRAARR